MNRFIAVAKPAFSIHFGEDADLHRVRKFAKDLFLAIRETGTDLGTVENMNTATEEVFIEVAATRHMGRVRKIIEDELRKHDFGDVTVARR